ncbi:MAG: hypothetical protein ACLT98_03330 [Eggerthellaceae bacterium]
MSGLYAALCVYRPVGDNHAADASRYGVRGSRIRHRPNTCDYQPMHVNFGIMEPFAERIRNKQQRYAAYAQRGERALRAYVDDLREAGVL